MNEEYKRVWLAFFKILGVVIIALIWSLAGRGLGVHRRFVLPLYLASYCTIFHSIQRPNDKSWWQYWLMIPTYFILMSAFSYGGSSFLRPLGILPQRFIVGLLWSLPAYFVARVNKCWSLFGFHVLLFTTVMAFLGAVNPINASAEELLIGFFFALMVPFMVTYKEKPV